MSKHLIISDEQIVSKIYFIRGQRAMLDFDLAQMYGTETRILKQGVKRNLHRFPEDFMFKLTKQEWKELITNCDNLGTYKFSPALPFAFTEHGAVMLANVLNNSVAVEASTYVVRAFVKIRNILNTYKELEIKIKELERKTRNQYKKHSEQLSLVFQTLNKLIEEQKQNDMPRKKIGYKIKGEE